MKSCGVLLHARYNSSSRNYMAYGWHSQYIVGQQVGWPSPVRYVYKSSSTYDMSNTRGAVCLKTPDIFLSIRLGNMHCRRHLRNPQRIYVEQYTSSTYDRVLENKRMIFGSMWRASFDSNGRCDKTNFCSRSIGTLSRESPS